MRFDPDRLLALLPRRNIEPLVAGTELPRRKSVSNMPAYNGFTGKERLRTFEVQKWLARLGAMVHSGGCDICGAPAKGQHAEDYYDLATWMDLCNSCHARLHRRFNDDRAWLRRLDETETGADHWARAVSTEPFDLASLLRARGTREPGFSDYLAAPPSP